MTLVYAAVIRGPRGSFGTPPNSLNVILNQQNLYLNLDTSM
jgi:hypothetical protein